MTLREVVLDRDIRAPSGLSPAALIDRYSLRRSASIAALMAFDVLAVVLVCLSGPGFWHIFRLPIYHPTGGQTAAVAAVAVLVAAATHLYGVRALRRSRLRILHCGLITLFLLAVTIIFTNGHVRGPSVFLLWLPAVSMAIVLRIGYDALVYHFVGPADAHRAIMVGRPAYCEWGQYFVKNPPGQPELRMLGAVTDEVQPREWEQRTGLTGLGVLAQFEQVLDRTAPAEVVITDCEMARDSMPRIVEACRQRRIILKLAAAEYDEDTGNVCFMPGFGVPLFVVKPHPMSGTGYVSKRCADVVLTLLGLVLLSPLMLACALIIKLTSPGPVFYSDWRIGVGQKPFRCFKFRTMQQGAAEQQSELEDLNEASGAIFKIKDDPRVTKVGRTLRRWSMDELPQLFNVLKGDMSLVGPRPLPLRDCKRMDDWHKRRHVVLPGVTGPWQASGRSDVDFDDMIRLDFRYIEDWSLYNDFKVMVRTVAAVVFSRGAY